jgi:fatty acid desaturase
MARPGEQVMAVADQAAPKTNFLHDADFKEQLQQLRQTDNRTNWYYLGRTYLYLAAVIGATIWFYHDHAALGLSSWWNVPVTLAAIVLIGAGQHQLTGLAHEAAHHILFQHRLLNDLVSDWLCMFPLFSSTHHYRLQHLAHHQFVNDPVRDPDISQLQSSGHWLAFPLGKKEFIRQLLKRVWPPLLIRYMRIRAKYNAMPTERNPYLRKNWKPSTIPVRVGIGYILSLMGLLAGLVWLGNPLWLAVAGPAAWLGIMVFYGLLPRRLYHQSRVHPVISARLMTLGRMTFISLLFNALAWITWASGRPAWLYFGLLWVVPIFSSFSFFMVLRQLVQHGNGGRGWLTNTRVFFVHRLIQFSVFPLGQEYHLPHHLFATVPHYRLPDLHELLLEYPEYRREAVVVHGYFQSGRPPLYPTVLEVLGPAYAPRDPGQVHIDNSVLDDDHVEDKNEILKEVEAAQDRLRTAFSGNHETDCVY